MSVLSITVAGDIMLALSVASFIMVVNHTSALSSLLDFGAVIANNPGKAIGAVFGKVITMVIVGDAIRLVIAMAAVVLLSLVLIGLAELTLSNMNHTASKLGVLSITIGLAVLLLVL